MAGQKEYEVELQFSSGILNVPDRIKAAEDVTFDGEKVPLIHNDDDLDNISQGFKDHKWSAQGSIGLIKSRSNSYYNSIIEFPDIQYETGP